MERMVKQVQDRACHHYHNFLSESKWDYKTVNQHTALEASAIMEQSYQRQTYRVHNRRKFPFEKGQRIGRCLPPICRCYWQNRQLSGASVRFALQRGECGPYRYIIVPAAEMDR